MRPSRFQVTATFVFTADNIQAAEFAVAAIHRLLRVDRPALDAALSTLMQIAQEVNLEVPSSVHVSRAVQALQFARDANLEVIPLAVQCANPGLYQPTRDKASSLWWVCARCGGRVDGLKNTLYCPYCVVPTK